MLLDLIAEWAGIINQTSAAARMAELKADLNETWSAGSDPLAGQAGSDITAYYRIQSPHPVIEYAPQNDEPANQVHTIYRDPTNDYGFALQQEPWRLPRLQNPGPRGADWFGSRVILPGR
jgi:hypothetical protein